MVLSLLVRLVLLEQLVRFELELRGRRPVPMVLVRRVRRAVPSVLVRRVVHRHLGGRVRLRLRVLLVVPVVLVGRAVLAGRVCMAVALLVRTVPLAGGLDCPEDPERLVGQACQVDRVCRPDRLDRADSRHRNCQPIERWTRPVHRSLPDERYDCSRRPECS